MANELTNKVDALFRDYLKKIAMESENLILKRFDKEQDVDGKKNFNKAPLKKSTQEDRKRKGYPKSRPILRRTGKLRDSIKVSVDDLAIELKSSLPYAEDLNDGNHSGFWGGRKINADMKPRKFLKFPKEIKTGGKIRKRLYEKLMKDYEKILRDFMIGRVFR